MAITDDLKRVPLFSDLDGRQLKKLSEHFRERTLEPGTSVVQEGTMSGVGFFVIGDGEVTVSRDGNELATLGPGSHFGELALISERQRNATVTAKTPMTLVTLTGWDMKRMERHIPDAIERVRATLEERRQS